MSAFNTKKHSQPKGMRMDKANGELEKVAEVGGSGGQSVGCCPTCGAEAFVLNEDPRARVIESAGAKSYRGVFVSHVIHSIWDESVWTRAVDEVLANRGLRVLSVNQLIHTICHRIAAEDQPRMSAETRESLRLIRRQVARLDDLIAGAQATRGDDRKANVEIPNGADVGESSLGRYFASCNGTPCVAAGDDGGES